MKIHEEQGVSTLSTEHDAAEKEEGSSSSKLSKEMLQNVRRNLENRLDTITICENDDHVEQF